jgi:ketosteroid isomerase-like protein
LLASTGATYLTGVCWVVQVAYGHVTRIDEYLDSSVQAFGREHAVRG